MSLYQLIYDFFYQHVFSGGGSTGYGLDEIHFHIANQESFQMDDWLCHTATLISITIIVVLCCLMIYKIIKLIGGLIR